MLCKYMLFLIFIHALLLLLLISFLLEKKMCKTHFLCFFAVIFCFSKKAGGAPWNAGFMADRQHALLHDPAPTQPTFNLMPPGPDMVGAYWT